MDGSQVTEEGWAAWRARLEPFGPLSDARSDGDNVEKLFTLSVYIWNNIMRDVTMCDILCDSFPHPRNANRCKLLVMQRYVPEPLKRTPSPVPARRPYAPIVLRSRPACLQNHRLCYANVWISSILSGPPASRNLPAKTCGTPYWLQPRKGPTYAHPPYAA